MTRAPQTATNEAPAETTPLGYERVTDLPEATQAVLLRLINAAIPQPLTLNHEQAARLLGVSNTTFWEIRRAGILAACQSPIPNRWSRLALEAWSIHGYVPSTLRAR